MRLDRFISSQKGDLSRSGVKELCRKGQVTVNGAVVKRPELQINVDSDSVCVCGEKIEYCRYIYIMLNKPAGCVCSTKEDGSSPSVLLLLPPELRRKGLFPAGRLDKDTEGLVLITDDGALAHRILSPKNHVSKKYYVRLERPVEETYPAAFASGMDLGGGDVCLPAELLPDTDDPFACHVTLCQGMFHQVKRMFEKLGNKVTYLKRISIGGLVLDENLPLGNYLLILHKDVETFL